MSERTPQDVLREAVHAILNETKGDPEYMAGFEDACASILLEINRIERLDKAIAEAPDSPPELHRFASINPDDTCPVDGFPAWAHDPAQAVMHQWKAAPDTLSEKPGLDALIDRELETVKWGIRVYEDDARERAYQRGIKVGVTALQHVQQAVAARYVRSGSTDSEGR